METFRYRFEVPYEVALHPTRHLFAPDNPLLAEVMRTSAERPVKTLFVLEHELRARWPGLAGAMEAYARQHPGEIGLAGPVRLLKGGERLKNQPAQIQRLLEAFNRAGLCRHSCVVAVGGGALLDAVGFAAAIHHRGLRLVRVPTTVLAQCDSGVGVKNGLNMFGKKNLVGAFAPPWAVINDGAFLATLEDRDWRAGLAEAVKVAVLKDASLFERLEELAPRLVRRDQAAMDEVVHRSARLHLEHIATAGDPFEFGTSRPLDLGHWSAHKLEQLTCHRLRHGEAVAVGLALDATYAHAAAQLDEASWRRLLQLLETLGFALYVPELRLGLDRPEDVGSILHGLEEFREHLGGRLTICLPGGIGRACEVHAVDLCLLARCVEFLAARATEKGGTPWAPRPVFVP